MSNEADRTSRYVLPKPGIPKTLGILSVIFATLCILYGTCTLGTTAFAGVIMDLSSNSLKEIQKTVEAKQQASLRLLDEQEKAATTEQEKASIRGQRDSIKNQPRADAQVATMDAAKETLKDPILMAANYGQILTGLLLSILLLVSGIGLIRLRPRGRSLSVTWASLQIAQLFLVAALQYAVVIPANKPLQDKQIATLEAEARKGNNPAVTGSLQMAKMLERMVPAFLVIYILLGSIYPTVVLIMLNGSGARAALQGTKQPSPSDPL